MGLILWVTAHCLLITANRVLIMDLIFENTQPGRRGSTLLKSDVPSKACMDKKYHRYIQKACRHASFKSVETDARFRFFQEM